MCKLEFTPILLHKQGDVFCIELNMLFDCKDVLENAALMFVPVLCAKYRKRIETLFSQLCDQFMIHKNYAKSFDGFKNRILSKIMALTIIQYINKLNNRKINNLKIRIA